ncbi:MAG TPA: HNH endonuclease signature motif containing protein [Solirubrobacteraceae bacterium]|nr:HNH endonuclease signature motif containing protein [Solirubrobacteraceae bacterium]
MGLYVKGGLLGLGVGAGVGLLGVLIFVYLRRELTVRRFGAAIPAAVPAARRGTPDDPRRRRSIPERVRHEVWRRDEACCVDCGSRERLEFDHIIPISKGGSNTARNIELRCENCNRRKGDKI